MINMDKLIKKYEAGEYLEKYEGYFNTNYVVELDGTKYILRVPKKSIVKHEDIKVDEYALLSELCKIRGLNLTKEVRKAVFNGVSLQATEYLEGTTLDRIYGDCYSEKSFPLEVAEQIAIQVATLHKSPISKSLNKFGHKLEKDYYQDPFWEDNRYYEKERENKELLAIFGISLDEIKQNVAEKTAQLVKMPFTLCHNDLHRGNIIKNENTISFIDWELADFSDPCKDIALHFQKTQYRNPNIEKYFLKVYYDLNPVTLKYKDFEKQVYTLFALKTVESLLRHIGKISKQYVELDSNSSEIGVLVMKLKNKIENYNRFFHADIDESEEAIRNHLEEVKARQEILK